MIKNISIGMKLRHSDTGAVGEVIKKPYILRRNCGRDKFEYVDVAVWKSGKRATRQWRTDHVITEGS